MNIFPYIILSYNTQEEYKEGKRQKGEEQRVVGLVFQGEEGQKKNQTE
jgi:hypothetical protein